MSTTNGKHLPVAQVAATAPRDLRRIGRVHAVWALVLIESSVVALPTQSLT